MVGQAPQGRGHGTEPDGIQAAFGQLSQTQSLIFGWCCVGSGVGLDVPCGSLSAQDIL